VADRDGTGLTARREDRQRRARQRQQVKRAAVVGAVFVVLAAFIVLRPTSEPMVGSVAPELELTSVEGEVVNLGDYLWRPVAITFMHSY
jgi:hypothetical protein